MLAVDKLRVVADITLIMTVALVVRRWPISSFPRTRRAGGGVLGAADGSCEEFRRDQRGSALEEEQCEVVDPI